MESLRTSCTLVVILFHHIIGISSDHMVKPACGPDEESCVFSLVVRHALSMTSLVPDDESEHRRPIIIFPNGTHAVRMRPDCDGLKFIDSQAISDVVTLDGSYKMIMTVNNQMPGPPIVVYGGQEVVVNVTNELLSEALTLHWHGQHQMGTPWMDGTGGVSHCPITPGETFTYRFVAHPSGTFWYHAHEGVQRTEGVHGAFIVLPRPGSTKYKVSEAKYPDFAGDHIMTLQDLYRQSSHEVYTQWVMDIGRYANHYDDLHQCYNDRLNVDGYQNTYIQPRSLLINGRGWHYDDNSTVPENTGVPLERYKVTRGHNYRFRVINAALALTLRVSVDGHVVNVIATDGFLVESRAVESIVIAPGERYDFWINATDPDKTGLYWIRVEGIEWTTNGPNKQRVRPIHTEALLSYDDVTTKEIMPVLETQRSCSDVTPCQILNCPYQYYPPEEHMICVPVTSLKPAIPERPLLSRDGDVTYDHFLHLHYAGSHKKSFKRIATIDSKLFKVPNSPPQIYPQSSWAGGDGVCLHEEVCDKEFCPCTHVMKVDMGTVVQITILVMAHENNPNPATHPIHMHGHSFQVVKIGYPKYDVTTGRVLSQSADVTCSDGEASCHRPAWSNTSWVGGKLPGVADDVIRKDTVAVPVGGYVVLRFETTNPGFWFLHCHMAFHAAQGMALIIQEGDLVQMPATPDNFKTCGNFIWSDDDFRKLTNFQYGKDAYQVDIAAQRHYNIPSSNGDLLSGSRPVQAALAVTVSLLVAAIALCLVLFYKLRKMRKGYSMVPSGVFSSDEYSPDDAH